MNRYAMLRCFVASLVRWFMIVGFYTQPSYNVNKAQPAKQTRPTFNASLVLASR